MHKQTLLSASLVILVYLSAVVCASICFILRLAILGLSSIGRSVVFVPQDSDSAEIAHVIDEQQCEVVMIRRSRLAQLESALDTSYCKSLRVVLYTECDYVEKTETGDTLRCDETLMEEYNLQVLPLYHIMNEDYCDYGMHVIDLMRMRLSIVYCLLSIVYCLLSIVYLICYVFLFIYSLNG